MRGEWELTSLQRDGYNALAPLVHLNDLGSTGPMIESHSVRCQQKPSAHGLYPATSGIVIATLQLVSEDGTFRGAALHCNVSSFAVKPPPSLSVDDAAGGCVCFSFLDGGIAAGGSLRAAEGFDFELALSRAGQRTVNACFVAA